MKITRYEMIEGEILPPFYYGYSHRDFGYDVTYFYPTPINYLVRFCIHAKYKWDKFRSKPSRLDIEIDKAVQRKEKILQENFDEEIKNAVISVLYNPISAMEYIDEKDRI